jgi:DNA-binding transcriptional MerR regulator
MRIGELAATLGIKPSAIRFYEASGLLPAGPRGANGYRDYDAAALKRLQVLQLAQRLGFSLDSLRTLFQAWDGGEPEAGKAQIMAQLEQRRAEIAAMRRQLDEQDAELSRLMQECALQWDQGRCVQLPLAAKPRKKLSAS